MTERHWRLLQGLGWMALSIAAVNAPHVPYLSAWFVIAGAYWCGRCFEQAGVDLP